MVQTSARLRKTFHYPDENDSDDSLPEALDEVEQEQLIHTLSTRSHANNKLYTRLFLSMPLLSILPYLRPLFRQETSLLALLSISSLLSSAYILFYLPQGRTGIEVLDAWAYPNNRSSRDVGLDMDSVGTSHTLPRLGQRVDKGPVELYLPYLNMVLVALLLLAGLVMSGRRAVQVLAWFGFSWLPAVMYGVVLVVKIMMGTVDAGVGELEGLKYGFKGA